MNLDDLDGLLGEEPEDELFDEEGHEYQQFLRVCGVPLHWLLQWPLICLPPLCLPINVPPSMHGSRGMYGFWACICHMQLAFCFQFSSALVKGHLSNKLKCLSPGHSTYHIREFLYMQVLRGEADGAELADEDDDEDFVLDWDELLGSVADDAPQLQANAGTPGSAGESGLLRPMP